MWRGGRVGRVCGWGLLAYRRGGEFLTLKDSCASFRA